MNIQYKKYLPHIVAGAIVIAGVSAFLSRGSDAVLAGNIGITTYENGTHAMVQVPYRRDGQAGRVSVAVDLDENGSFEPDETVIASFPSQPKKYWNSNFFFHTAESLPEKVRVRVSYQSDDSSAEQVLQRPVYPVHSNVGVVKEDFAGVTLPELSMQHGETQVRAPVAQPVTASIGSYRFADTPDLEQRKAECAPTAAANSLISLAKEHGMSDKLPADSLTMVDELKGDMRWTPENGVLPDDFVAGKNLWAAKKGLPIRTDKVGDQRGQTTLDALARSLRNGGATELRLAFAEPVRGGFKVVGGHLVTVVGVHQDATGSFVDIHDPLSPSGVDTVRVQGNQLEYGFFNGGVTLMSWGFTQTWTGQEMDAMTDQEVQGMREFTGEKKSIKALHIGERYIPLEQVHVSKPDLCEANHWHANVGGVSRDTAGKLFPEIYPHCGYGKVTEVPVVDVELP